VLRQRQPARVNICCSLSFFKKKAEPPTPLAWAKDVGPVFAIVGTVASLVVAWNTVVIQPNKAQLQELRTELQELRTDQQKQLQEQRMDQQKQLQELRADQQKQLEVLSRLEQLLGPLKPVPERLARTEGQVDVVLKQQNTLLLQHFGPP
jgi:TolA-binding protein